MENTNLENQEVDVKSTPIESNVEFKNVILNVGFHKAKNNYNKEFSAVKIALKNGYSKDIAVDDDYLELAKILSADNGGKCIKQYNFVRKISKKKESEYTALDIELVNGAVVSLLCSYSFLGIVSALADRLANSSKK